MSVIQAAATGALGRVHHPAGSGVEHTWHGGRLRVVCLCRVILNEANPAERLPVQHSGCLRSKEATMTMSRIVLAGAAALAACGVLGMASPAVQASSSPVPTWTKQAPAV